MKNKLCTKCKKAPRHRAGRCKPCELMVHDAKRFKISYEEIVILRQRKECDICTLPFLGNRDQHIDHCHDSGQIRGVLCRNCNIMLGYAKDNPQRLLNAVKYLEQHYSHWESVLNFYKK